MSAIRPRLPVAALAVVAGGVAAALHIGKLPPAVTALQASLGIGLVQAGFLLSLVQVAGMVLGLAVGLAADAIGLRRSMLAGLLLLSFASAAGGGVGLWVADPGTAFAWLLALRALEGLGFLLAVMPGPGLIRSVAAHGSDKTVMGLWGSYMPLGVALALLLGPAVIARVGWPGWWLALAATSAVAAAWVALAVPADRMRGGAPVAGAEAWSARLGATLRAPGPRTLALAFAVYAAQWIAVIGFLPTIYADAGVPVGWSAALTALAAATNIVGNVTGGRLLQRGVAPVRLLRWGFIVMALASLAAFVRVGGPDAAWSLPPALRHVAICVFSLAGGVVPATLFMLGVRLAPGGSTVSTTIGLMQQASSLGQFLAPPAVGWLAHRLGGWQWTWALTLGCSLVGLAMAARLRAHPALGRTAA
ncbi:MFS transporter [Variovorax sp. J22P168]|uniref:MFS transporter n=1 Tax=Variovorax jilinensis TaxID=3053513 RepID=UPI00257804B1|nr:MFS transporter [Variovorax sp. J22P168]MDM0011398.1 MFS transporter [Variovorax sp. J22P168]